MMTSELRRRHNAGSDDGGDGGKVAPTSSNTMATSPYHFLVADTESDKNTPPSTPSREVPTGTRQESDGGGGFNFFGLFTPTRKDAEPGPPAKNTHILIEVVAAQNLQPVTDLLGNKANDLILTDGAGNPYATIRMETASGTQQSSSIIHKTRPSRTKTLSPIWTVRTSSLYLLLVNDKEFRLSGGLTFEVLTGRGALLPFSHGQVTVPPPVVLDGDGERLEFRLIGSNVKEGGDSDDDEKAQNNILALRFRHATEEDLQFMMAVQPTKDLRESVTASSTPKAKSAGNIDTADIEEMDAFDKRLFVGEPADFQFKQDRPPRGHRQSKTAKQLNLVELRGGSKGDESRENEKLVRVQPYPDPKRPAETAWLSPTEVEMEAKSASKKWIKAGTGDFGTMYVEVIKCDGLPNLDQTVPPTGDKTDAFVAVLFEDTLVRTDVIFDRLNPRWMPWSMRAFAFPIKHPTSPLILGAFDYDDGPMNAHDPIGRVVINMSQFECDTVYVLTYKLHSSPTKDDDNGTITIRLRIEYNDEKKAYLESFGVAPRFHVNVDNTKAYDVLKYLCKGQVHMDKATTTTVKLYAYEWLSYFEYWFYAIDFMIGVLLWRGEAKFGERHMWFPVHSAVLFSAAVITIENPSLIPASFFLGISYIMGTIGYMRSHYPYPWDRCKSIMDVSSVITIGKNINRPIVFEPNQGAKEAENLERINQAKTDRVLTFLKAVKTAGLKFNREYNKTDAEAIAIETEDNDWSLFGAYLSYAHLALYYMCTFSRGIRNLVTWRSSHSYFITVYCFFTGVALLILPWGFILTWIARIFAWTLLGPWMKIFDIYVVKDYYRTRAELAADPTIEEPDIDALFADSKYTLLAKKVRIAAEDAIKLKDMREHRFGMYSQKTPAFDDSRFPSIPLPQSTARPFDPSGSEGIEYKYLGKDECSFNYLPGQKLRGTMVHIRAEEDGDDEASVVDKDD